MPSMQDVEDSVGKNQRTRQRLDARDQLIYLQYLGCDCHEGSPRSRNRLTSSKATTEVPNLPTATPPAALANVTASVQSSPQPRMIAKAAITVSPAPDTSNT